MVVYAPIHPQSIWLTDPGFGGQQRPKSDSLGLAVPTGRLRLEARRKFHSKRRTACHRLAVVALRQTVHPWATGSVSEGDALFATKCRHARRWRWPRFAPS